MKVAPPPPERHSNCQSGIHDTYYIKAAVPSYGLGCQTTTLMDTPHALSIPLHLHSQLLMMHDISFSVAQFLHIKRRQKTQIEANTDTAVKPPTWNHAHNTGQARSNRRNCH